ncbi:polysaccharide pyruvyl transferase family protein [Rhodococcus sp. NPDC059234]|uniref:polysaccharide pyruvyl transferase family protein n=1 Tax=Rhodococcus sp. NPDC059234 TaxID=3346781 RepID=UPI00366BEC48
MANNNVGATAVPGDELRVLVENAEYWLNNRGDLAMMHTTVERLRARWPNARVGVLTYQPVLLRALVPGAEPVSYRRGGDWARDRWHHRLPQLAGPRVVGPPVAAWRAATEEPRRRLRTVRRVVRARLGAGDGSAVVPAGDSTAVSVVAGLPRVPAAARSASLVVALGGGYMTDGDLYQAHRTLNLLEHAISLGIPTAMVGQGIGPMEDPLLMRRAAEVLPRVGFIALREGRRGGELLARLGVAADSVLVTGDDAVEFGYRMRRDATGSDIGVCLRIAAYTSVDAPARDTVGRVVRSFAARVNAGLVPLIVSEEGAEDRRSTLPLLNGFARSRPVIGRFGSASELAEQIAGCRLLVTGAYHAAVFALAQGIPVVGLSASRLYNDKLYGLAEMFGGGLTVVHLDGEQLEETLTNTMRELWDEGPDLRVPLQAKALAQVAASRAGFDRIFRLVESGRGRTP